MAGQSDLTKKLVREGLEGSRVEVPTGTLLERLQALAALHERNALLCAPTDPAVTRAGLEVANRHARIHEQAAADIREACALLIQRAAA